MKLTNILTGLIILPLIFYSCDAPHNNPLEFYEPEPVHDTVEIIIEVPEEVYTVEGFVRSRHETSIPVSGVFVSWNNTQGSLTDNNGFFTIPNVENSNGTLYFTREGYINDTLNVVWGSEDTVEVEFYMNQLPEAVNEVFYSSIIYDYPEQTYGSLYFSVEIVEDVYEDITEVTLRNQSLGYSKTLTADTDNVYETEIFETDLSLNDIDEIIGREFILEVEYADGSFYEVIKTNISRVIRNNVQFISPANNEIITITRNPFLTWEKVEPGFLFHYITAVYTNEVNPELVWESGNIASDKISKRVDEALPNGEYFWVIWVVDSYGNRARSKPASFIVELSN